MLEKNLSVNRRHFSINDRAATTPGSFVQLNTPMKPIIGVHKSMLETPRMGEQQEGQLPIVANNVNEIQKNYVLKENAGITSQLRLDNKE